MHTHMRLVNRLRALLACRRGASAIEAAFALPIFILLITGIAELSMVLFVSVLAEGGLREAARYGLTGQVPGATTREEQLVQIVKDHTHGLIEISPSNVTFRVYDEFGHIDAEEPFVDANGNGKFDDGEDFTDWNGNDSWDKDTGEAGSGAAGEIVFYEIEYQWSFLTPLFQVFGGDDGKLDLNASIAIRNEPYDADGDAT